MVALPAVLVSKNSRKPLPPLVKVALPAVLAFLKSRVSLLVMVALPPLMVMPAPLNREV